MEIIDSHIHPPLSGGRNYSTYPYMVAPIESTEIYVDHLKDSGVTRCCGAVICPPKGAFTHASVAKMNQSALEFQHKVGDFYLPGFQLELDNPEKSCPELEHYYRNEGVRWIGETFIRSIRQGGLVDPRAFEIYDLAQHLEIPISIYSMEKELVWAICKEFSHLNIVTSHSVKAPSDLEAWLGLIKQEKNLYIDLPGNITSRYGLIKRVVKEIGSHKLIFGSGFPLGCARGAIGNYLGSGLNDSQLEAIFSLNFKRLTGIE